MAHNMSLAFHVSPSNRLAWFARAVQPWQRAQAGTRFNDPNIVKRPRPLSCLRHMQRRSKAQHSLPKWEVIQGQKADWRQNSWAILLFG
jgi:hypothetical protein